MPFWYRDSRSLWFVYGKFHEPQRVIGIDIGIVYLHFGFSHLQLNIQALKEALHKSCFLFFNFASLQILYCQKFTIILLELSNCYDHISLAMINDWLTNNQCLVYSLGWLREVHVFKESYFGSLSCFSFCVHSNPLQKIMHIKDCLIT